MDAEKVKIRDIVYGLIIPVIVGLIIVAFPAVLRPALNDWFPSSTQNSFLTSIFTHGLAQIVVFAVPLILGLVWNKWAGGASGFILGTLFYVASAGYFTAEYGYNLWRDPSYIGNYIICGMLVGYTAGSLSGGSLRFRRMLTSGVTAAVTIGLLQFFFSSTIALYGAASMALIDPGTTFLRLVLPNIVLGIIAPIVAKVMILYALYPKRGQTRN